MSIVVSQSLTWVQGASYIGYDNLYLRMLATVVANAEDTGQTGALAVSWLTYSGGWQATGVGVKTLTVSFPLVGEDANSYGVYKHNLGTLGLTVKLQHSSDGVAWTDLIGSAKVPANDEAIFFIGATINAKFWRIHIAGLLAGETLIIGQAFIGPSLRVFAPPEAGFTPPNLGLNSDFITSRSDGGDFLGRSLIRKGSKSGFLITNVAAAWVRSDWLPLIKEVEKHPFYYGWDNVNHADEVAFCYTDGKITVPRYESSLFFNVSLNFIALLE
jgi:hypothetical protein